MILCVIKSSINIISYIKVLLLSITHIAISVLSAFFSAVGFDADSGDVITAGEFFQNHEQYKLTGAFSKHWKSPVKAGCLPPPAGGSVAIGNGG